MNLTFISGVKLGWYALKGIIDSVAFQKGDIDIKAVFSLTLDKSDGVSGYQTFDELAASMNIPLQKITSIKLNVVLEQIKHYDPDLICIIGWSELAPPQLLNIPKEKYKGKERHSNSYGCIGIHPTLLPEGRGRAPVPWTIIKGQKKSGVTLFYLEDDADAGDIIAQREFDILFKDDAQTIYDKIAHLHYEIMRDNLPLLVSGTAPRRPQDPSKATVWRKRTPKDGIIDWNKSQIDQYNWIRALTHPYPGAYTFWRDHPLIIWKASLDYCPTLGKPGTVVDILSDGIVVACSDGNLILKQLQLRIPGEQELSGRTFADHYKLLIGESFTTLLED